jgi:pyridoxal phosphate enzyme (YggS family)
MSVNLSAYRELKKSLGEKHVELVAVSKMQPLEKIQILYEEGQRDFGENYVQELIAKEAALPRDIRWHFIGHLQSNKVKQICSFVHLIHGVDSEKLLMEIEKQARKINRRVDVLLQMHIAREETKFGMDEKELEALFLDISSRPLSHVRIRGLMGMASFSDNEALVRDEFRRLRATFQYLANRFPPTTLDLLSMGMSNDYTLAVEEGSNLVRIGSLIFGSRT